MRINKEANDSELQNDLKLLSDWVGERSPHQIYESQDPSPESSQNNLPVVPCTLRSKVKSRRVAGNSARKHSQKNLSL